MIIAYAMKNVKSRSASEQHTIYCKREVDYAFYGTYACDTRIVRYVGILRRSLVLTASDSNKTAFSFFCQNVRSIPLNRFEMKKHI